VRRKITTAYLGNHYALSAADADIRLDKAEHYPYSGKDGGRTSPCGHIKLLQPANELKTATIGILEHLIKPVRASLVLWRKSPLESKPMHLPQATITRKQDTDSQTNIH